MLASDVNNPGFVGAHDPDSVFAVRFFNRAIKQNYESEKQGRPIFADVPYVEISNPGDRLTIICVPVRPEHKRRWPRQWMAFEQGNSKDTRETGTPLDQWPQLTAAQAEEFKALKFFTVEQIAGASDAQLQAIGMVGGSAPMQLREKAKAFLAFASGTALPQAQAAELAAAKQQMADMQAQLNALMATQAGLTPAAEAPKKRGRKPKVVAEAMPPTMPPPEPIAEQEQPRPI